MVGVLNMAGTVFLFYAFALETVYCSLRQFPGLIEVAIGSDIILNCNISDILIPCNSIFWFKASRRTGEIKPLSAVRDPQKTTGRQCINIIRNATIKDSGTYYCSGTFSVLTYVGNGSLVVIMDPKAEPSIILYISQDITRPMSDGTGPSIIFLQCVVMGIVNSQVRVFWTIGQREIAGWTEPAWTNDSDSSTEFIRAHLSVSAEEWTKGQEIKCIVKYNGQTISKSLQIPDSVCAPLLYASSGVAFLIIAVAVIAFVYLRRGMISSGHTMVRIHNQHKS